MARRRNRDIPLEPRYLLLVGLGALGLAVGIVVVIALYGGSLGWDLSRSVTGRGGAEMPFGAMLLIAGLFLILLAGAGISMVVGGFRLWWRARR